MYICYVRNIYNIVILYLCLYTILILILFIYIIRIIDNQLITILVIFFKFALIDNNRTEIVFHWNAMHYVEMQTMCVPENIIEIQQTISVKCMFHVSANGRKKV